MPIPLILASLLAGGGGAAGAAGAAGAGAAAGGGGASALLSKIPGFLKAGGAGSGGPTSLVTGIIQGIKANKAKKEADNLQPSLYDPAQMAMLAEIQQKARSINTGSAFAADMGYIDSTTAGTNQAITQATGGDVSGTIQGLLAAQANAGRVKNQVLGRADAQSQFYNSMAVDMQRQISSRAMELQLAMQDQAKAQWAQGNQNAFSNSMAGAALADPGAINWLEIAQSVRDARARKREGIAPPMFTSNPEMDARALEPIDSTIDTVDVEETDTLFPIK